MFSIVQPPDEHGLPAYLWLANAVVEESYFRGAIWLNEFFPFVATLLELSKSSSTSASLTSLEDWWTTVLKHMTSQETQTQVERILVTMRQQLAEVTLGFLRELPMAGSWMDE